MKPTNNQVYLWNLLGNVFAAAISVVLLMITSRLLSANQADEFSIAYSLGHLWVVIGLFQVRNYQATDVQFTHQFESYFTLRLFTVCVMIGSIIPYLYMTSFYEYTVANMVFIFLVILYRMWDAFADVFQGLFQQHERLDIAGKSMVIRYGTSMFVWLVMIYLTNSLVFSIVALIVWNGIVVYRYDYLPSRAFISIQWKNIVKGAYLKDAKHILRACMSLFVNGFILVYIFNEPKLVIGTGLKQGWLQEGMQRDYNILFMPVFFMSLCILVIRPLITKMAKLHLDKHYRVFYQTMRHITVSLFGFGIIATGLAYLIGTPILSLVFGVKLAGYELSLMILVFSGVLYALAIFTENILTIFRKQHYLLLVYGMMLVVSKILTMSLVKQHGVLGASLSFLIVMIVYLIGCILLLFKWRGK
ncbi:MULTISPECIES: lipopolysaccharide biosynthesis protein [unclassified Granulicatella]|uniref:lipopolysaccharide biosynthesis protein n=1 Tax=unclassified Granulicatella TaxID=2630493 RepID=UPI001073D4AF|nr:MULTISPECIES: lipopolysaccharide biosynthesis protein [unclassified Granulicatella]MBF0780251.1 lipopolysaccharide biosynthesis protein [Granulicatella sp. 19428wC4_WM01]TFU95632.1 lipopolysaccharide biosynthesis protein [Granulicatella sp. WM01]